MNADQLRAYCLAKPGAWEDEPWEGDTVAKVSDGSGGGKIFAFLGAGSVGVKCGANRDEADEWLLRFPDDASVMAYIGRSGWNTLRIGSAIPDDEIRDAVDTLVSAGGLEAAEEASTGRLGVAVARHVQVTFDCADPNALAGFWAEVLGYQYDAPPPGFDTWEAALDAWGVPADQRNSRSAIGDPDGAGPRLFFQQVPEGKSAKNRVHLDVRAAPGLEGEARMAALESECDRLVALGGTRVRRFEPDQTSNGFIVMQDPEGNEFCLD